MLLSVANVQATAILQLSVMYEFAVVQVIEVPVPLPNAPAEGFRDGTQIPVLLRYTTDATAIALVHVPIESLELLHHLNANTWELPPDPCKLIDANPSLTAGNVVELRTA